MTDRNWLVTGASGQVGGALEQQIGSEARWFPRRAELDLAALPDPATLEAMLRDHGITAIINCAAYTVVDKAESEQELAHIINGDAPGQLALAAAALAIPILHLSTDFVFDGGKGDGFWTEQDPVAPLNAFGRTKLAGEQALQTSGARHIILRTAWVVSAAGSNFVKTMFRLGREREQLGVVNNQFGCPTSAAAVTTLADMLTDDASAPTGIVHFANAGEASWFDLARFVFDRAAEAGVPPPKLDSIPTAAYPTPARRPANSRLSTQRIEQNFGITPRHWHDAVGEVVDALLKEQGI